MTLTSNRGSRFRCFAVIFRSGESEQLEQRVSSELRREEQQKAANCDASRQTICDEAAGLIVVKRNGREAATVTIPAIRPKRRHRS
jgi:hypothetical protein